MLTEAIEVRSLATACGFHAAICTIEVNTLARHPELAPPRPIGFFLSCHSDSPLCAGTGLAAGNGAGCFPEDMLKLGTVRACPPGMKLGLRAVWHDRYEFRLTLE